MKAQGAASGKAFPKSEGGQRPCAVAQAEHPDALYRICLGNGCVLGRSSRLMLTHAAEVTRLESRKSGF